MTREQARKAAEVMLAYADGKTIECLADDEIGWVTVVKSATFNWCDCDYRIKDSPSYRPFKDAGECFNEMQKHKPIGWIKNIGNKSTHELMLLTDFDDELLQTRMVTMSFEEALNTTTFADGTPFGIKK